MQDFEQDILSENALSLISENADEDIFEKNARQLVEDEQRLQCMNYLRLQLQTENKGGKIIQKTMQTIADEMGIHIMTLRKWIKGWQDSGIMRDMLAKLNDELAEEYRSTMRLILQQFNHIVLDQLTTALTADKPLDRHRSAVFIRELIEKNIEGASVENNERFLLPDAAGFNPLRTVSKIKITMETTPTDKNDDDTVVDGEVVPS